MTATQSAHPKDDPLGFGLKSIAEPLQRWWLIRAGNPYFDAEVRTIRPYLEIPESGFTTAADFVDWVSRKRPHQHQLPIALGAGDHLIEGKESLTRFHYRNISWPIKEHELPAPCCQTDPLYVMAKKLAVMFGIEHAGSEPGFEDPVATAAGYILVNRWPKSKSVQGISWTEEISEINLSTGERSESHVKHTELGLRSSRGQGQKLAVWFEWWKLKSKKINEIAKLTDSDDPKSRTYDQRAIRNGIDAVERMMRPVEKLKRS